MEQFNQHNQQINNEIKIESQKPPLNKKTFFIIGILCLIGLVCFFLFKTGFTLSKIFFSGRSDYLNLVKNEPLKDPNRINILILGLRGEGDSYGGLLTDTMMILSIKINTDQVALISIPRDLYIQMPSANSKNSLQKERINFAYALGQEKVGERGGLSYGKAAISEVTNLYLDYAIAIDFTAFEKIVDILGGITIYLDKPFSENSQFAGEFLIDLPAGKNTLDGKNALYYVRSRFSSSDFDRAKRQQEVLLAIKDKALSAGILLDPVKFYNLLDALGAHIKTDMTINDFRELIGFYPHLDFKNIKRRVFDTSPEGLLYSSQNGNGAYVLLPVGGNFDKIQEASKNIFAR